MIALSPCPRLVFEWIESGLEPKSIRSRNVSGRDIESARLAQCPDTGALSSPERRLNLYRHFARSAHFMVRSGPFWFPNKPDYPMYRSEDIECVKFEVNLIQIDRTVIFYVLVYIMHQCNGIDTVLSRETAVA
jgi:hypothetical protein